MFRSTTRARRTTVSTFPLLKLGIWFEVILENYHTSDSEKNSLWANLFLPHLELFQWVEDCFHGRCPIRSTNCCYCSPKEIKMQLSNIIFGDFLLKLYHFQKHVDHSWLNIFDSFNCLCVRFFVIVSGFLYWRFVAYSNETYLYVILNDAVVYTISLNKLYVVFFKKLLIFYMLCLKLTLCA